MIRRMALIVGVVAILIVAAYPVAAIPSFRGYTGLMIIPTADALDEGEWNVGVFTEEIDDDVNNLIATYGLDENLEVGVARREPIGTDERDTMLYGKYQFLPETPERPGVAAGIIDITDEFETTAYIVASKSLGTELGVYEGEVINPRVHVGFGAGEFSSLFVGASAFLGNRIQVMIEWDSDNWHTGARLRITPGLTAHAGFFSIGDDADFGLGVSYGRAL